MTALQSFLNLTFYMVVADYSRFNLGIGGGTDVTTDFDDMAAEYADMRRDGQDAVMLEINMRDGTAKDVTKAAEARIAEWHNARREDLPEWMEAA